ncbi:MAG: lamin tail domain-containing protein [Thermoflexales bacterium]|nr:lamin tail domain-containing protein [Thermoflexales bacterium]MDW8350754.1 lamin tail domain-containing protein [Anaerolineae bacterium]
MQSPLRARHWIIFLLINVLVSAVTAFLVVQAYTRAVTRPPTIQATNAVSQSLSTPDVARPAAENAGGAQATALPAVAQEVAMPEVTALPAPTATPRPAGQSAGSASPKVRISAVVYPGQPSREAVVIVNEGDDVDLTGWTLSNPRGKVYTFGNVALFKESFINLHTTSGVDAPTNLFWNQSEAMWRVGDEVVLRRGDEVIATYIVR